MARIRFNVNNFSDVRMADLMQKVRRHGQAAVLGITVAGIVMAIPLLLIVFAGLLVGLMVYAAAALVFTGIDAVRSLVGAGPSNKPADLNQPPSTANFEDGDGRQNVRVIRDR